MQNTSYTTCNRRAVHAHETSTSVQKMSSMFKRMEPDDVRPDDPLQQLRTVRESTEQLRPAWTSTSSAPRPCFRLKLGHDVPLIHSNEWSEQHLPQTTTHPKLKHNLKFDTLVLDVGNGACKKKTIRAFRDWCLSTLKGSEVASKDGRSIKW